MRLITITPSQWEVAQIPVVTFIRRHGEKHIVHKTIRWLRQLSPVGLHAKGTYIITIFGKKNLIGVLAVHNHGRGHACVAVHAKYRRQGIGERLVRAALDKLDIFYARVAADNIPSLRLCFRCGLWAYKMTQGVTNKPTVHFVGGRCAPTLDSFFEK